MKTIIHIWLAALALLSAWTARAWSYNDGDLLLIFRESALSGGQYPLAQYPSPNNDVEFDLGSVTNYVGKTNGYTTTVTGWSLSNVQAVYGSDLTGVSVVLVAATSPTNPSPTLYFSAALPQYFWVNGVEPFNTAYSVSPAVWQAAWSKINSIGTRPGLYVPVSQQTASYSFSPSSILAYDHIVASDNYVKAGSQNTINQDWLPQFGGFAPFAVEGVAPGSFGFLAVTTNNVSTRSRDSYIGTFTIDNLGNLTFTAGPPTPVVTGITRSGNVNTVSFSTGLSGNYTVIYTNAFSGVTNWPVTVGSLVGDGNTNSITHATSDTAGFYRVVRTP